MTEKTETGVVQYIPPQTRDVSAFSSIANFEVAQRMASALANSALVPDVYRGNVANCLVALEVAQRCQASPLMVMQNLHMIEGRPSWASSYIIAAINSCGRFSPLRFKMADKGQKVVEYEYWEGPKGARQKKTGKMTIQNIACTASAVDRSGEILEGPEVSIETAVREGWFTRSGSKWQTMPELMLRYRAAAFFGRLYAPEILMGMRSDEEVRDIIDITPEETQTVGTAEEVNKKIRGRKAAPLPTAAAQEAAEKTVGKIVDAARDQGHIIAAEGKAPPQAGEDHF